MAIAMGKACRGNGLNRFHVKRHSLIVHICSSSFGINPQEDEKMTVIQSARGLALASSLVVASFSATGLQLAALSAGGMVVLAGEAMAQTVIPGVGVIVKKNPGSGAIVKGVSDDNGEVVFDGLEAGEFTVTVGTNRPQSFTISKGGGGIKVVVTGKAHNYTGHVTLLR